MPITPLPTPVPNRGMSEEDFANAGDNFLGALPTFATELNALQTDVTNKQTTASTAATTATTQATNASTSATSASTSATAASNYAVRTGSVVPSTSDWSAKEHAVGTSVTTGSAKDWATKTSGLVASTDYSAKYYAQAAQTAAAAAGSAAGLPSLSGNAGKVLSVNSLATGVEWATVQTIGDTTTTARTLTSPTWLLCDGSVYLKSSYTTLSGLLGSIYSKTPFTSTQGTTSLSNVVGNSAVTSGGAIVRSNNASSVYRSTDNGVTWVSIANSGSYTLSYFASNNSGVVVGAADNTVNGSTTLFRSTDNGASWSQVTSTAFNGMRPRAIGSYGTGNFVAVGLAGSTTATTTQTCIYSADGSTWNTSGSMGVTAFWYAVGVNLFNAALAVANGGQTSLSVNNGATWTQKTSLGFSASEGNTSVVYGDNYLWVVSSLTNVAYSADNGATWTTGTLPFSVKQMIYVPNIGYVGVGDTNKVCVSADGMGNWKVYAGISGQVYGAVVAAGGKVIAFNASGANSPATIFSPYGYDTSTSFAVPIISASSNNGVRTYIKASL